ncbi:hypothetical protein [Streptomyces sp. NPDC101237]|uniref:hypothetical protein n=1 Tax=Streptomyces sp. NPDC101237 TaxID=3366139 RepID=UPI0037F4D21D
MHLIRRLLTMAAAAAVVIATLVSAAPSAPAASAAPRAALCRSTWTAVQRAAVRKPAWNEGPVASTRAPIVRYLRKGERVTSCVIAGGRGGWSQYPECGGGTLWRVVPGGQVPSRCLRRT